MYCGAVCCKALSINDLRKLNIERFEIFKSFNVNLKVRFKWIGGEVDDKV